MIDGQWQQLIQKAKSQELSIQEIYDLAEALAQSGQIIAFEEFDTYDVASTGGPSSLSTLLCPLYLAAAGGYVPKLGVPGRPAGGIDVLQQIPGFNSKIPSNQLEAVLHESRYAHFISEGIYAPLDADTFRYRKSIDAQAIPELVVASLIAKKVAVDVKKIGLDVRIAKHGNIGSTFAAGHSFAIKFLELARMFDRNAVCFLTDASAPFQPFIGRGEALIALSKIFEGCSCSWLQKHNQLCGKMSEGLLLACKTVSSGSLKQAFENNICAQGSKFELFLAKVNEIQSQPRHLVIADKDGYVHYNLLQIRNFITYYQSKEERHIIFPDPVGIELLASEEENVLKGQPLVSIRYADPGILPNLPNDAKGFLRIDANPRRSREMEIVNE